MTKTESKCAECLIDNKVAFEQLIRCFNFWDRLSYGERTELIKAYDDGKFCGVGGHY